MQKSSNEPNKGSSHLDGSSENSNISQVGSQVAAVPLFIQFGAIECCFVVSSSAFDVCLEGGLKSIVPRKLWGDEGNIFLPRTIAYIIFCLY
jgi:hypothetical protein